MFDFKSTPDNDIAIEGGDIAGIDGDEQVAQDIRHALNFFQGEWYRDTTKGTPWLQRVLGKKPRPAVVKSIIRQVLLGRPLVDQIVSLDVSFRGATRTLTIAYVVISAYGKRIARTENIKIREGQGT